MSTSCFRHPCPSASTNPYLTACLYNTDVGLFGLSWSRTLFRRSLHLNHVHQHHHHAASFHLHMIKPNFTWGYNKPGSTKLKLINLHKPATIFWDLSSAKYGAGPQPLSGFYVAIVIDGEIILLVGDYPFPKQAYIARSRFQYSPMILRREYVCGTKLYSTRVNIGGHERNISIECRLVEDPSLYFSIYDNQRVLHIKHLKWKFRGNESIEIEGTYLHVSWDVYNWLFDHQDDGYALFMFTIFHHKSEFGQDIDIHINRNNFNLRPQFQRSLGEKKLMKKMKGLLGRSGRSSSISSLSSVNSSASSWTSCVMEWAANTEEDEFMTFPHSGFSLLVFMLGRPS